MPLYHNMRRDPSGNLFVAGSAGGMGVHTVNFTPTPTNTPTPTRTATPTPTPTLSLTPTPSNQSALNSSNALISFTSDGTGLSGTGNSYGFDGGGYTYSWNAFESTVSPTYYNSSNKAQGAYFYYNTGSAGNIDFHFTYSGVYGSLFNTPRGGLKVPYSPYSGGLTIQPTSTGTRNCWLMGAGVDGGTTLYWVATIRNNNNNTYRTLNSTISMDDWCTGSPSNTVAVGMNRRLDSSGNTQSLNCRIYFYTLFTSSSVASYEQISSIYFYNPNNDKARIVSLRTY
jgi:hypothetical protein